MLINRMKTVVYSGFMDVCLLCGKGGDNADVMNFIADIIKGDSKWSLSSSYLQDEGNCSFLSEPLFDPSKDGSSRRC